jgi:hypothetical protein
MLSDFDLLCHTISPPEQITLRRLAQVTQTSSSRAAVDQAIDASVPFLKRHPSYWTRHVVMKSLARNGIRLPSGSNLPAYWSFDGISRRLQRPPIQIPLIEGHDVDTFTRAEDPLVPADEFDHRIIEVKLSRALYLHQQHSTQQARSTTPLICEILLNG